VVRVGRLATAAICGLLASLAVAGVAEAKIPPYQENDFKGFRNILPPGTNGIATGLQIAAFQADGTRPAHNGDQLGMYANLVYATPGLKASEIGKYYKDASFGVRPNDIGRAYAPRGDVQIVRDKGFGVPHIYGTTRAGAMFGAGYAAAEDRLFLIDVLRHVGRSDLSAFLGPSESNLAMDRGQWRLAPYNEPDLQRQFDQFDDLYGAEGAQLQEDAVNYTAGVNKYMDEAKASPLTKLPGEYQALGHPAGPEPWKTTDIIAIAALVGGVFGKGGGNELGSTEVLHEAQKRFGRRTGSRVWRDFRSAEDPEAPTTVHRKRFPYQVAPRKRAAGSLALPDPGTLETEPVVASSTAPSGGSRSFLDFPRLPSGLSNALLVSARESKSGHPLMVAGPQTGYYAPQLLMEQGIHAPAVDGKPGIDAQGAAFAGTNLYVQLGRGRDYSWSATSAGQDNTDTFALDLCEPDGSKPTLESDHYRFRGQCRQFEHVERTNVLVPTAGGTGPPGQETLRTLRTPLGLVAARARIRGRPVAYTKLRSTYMHEVDSGPGFADFNNPAKMRNPRDFQRAAHKIGYTFNWLYADDKNVAYFNSGWNPRRASGTDPNLPVRGLRKFEWKSWNPSTLLGSFTPFSQHPQVVNQSFITSWNNKQARSYRASDSNWAYSALYRSLPLDDRIRRGIRGSRKMSLPQLIDAMETAGTVDFRGHRVLPLALRVLGRQGDPKLADAISKLQAWRAAGAHRQDRDRNLVYAHNRAIQIMDAWWERWLRAQFEPALGGALFQEILDMVPFDEHNRTDHIGSSFQEGWWGYVSKDLRTMLGRRVPARLSRRYCGRGSLALCRIALANSLRAAINAVDEADPPPDPYAGETIRHSPVGVIGQPEFHWINRPTFQQAVEIQGHGPRR
jgi:acyl-homoserine lactone acylase PvdQ